MLTAKKRWAAKGVVTRNLFTEVVAFAVRPPRRSATCRTAMSSVQTVHAFCGAKGSFKFPVNLSAALVAESIASSMGACQSSTITVCVTSSTWMLYVILPSSCLIRPTCKGSAHKLRKRSPPQSRGCGRPAGYRKCPCRYALPRHSYSSSSEYI